MWLGGAIIHRCGHAACTGGRRGVRRVAPGRARPRGRRGCGPRGPPSSPSSQRAVLAGLDRCRRSGTRPRSARVRRTWRGAAGPCADPASTTRHSSSTASRRSSISSMSKPARDATAETVKRTSTSRSSSHGEGELHGLAGEAVAVGGARPGEVGTGGIGGHVHALSSASAGSRAGWIVNSSFRPVISKTFRIRGSPTTTRSSPPGVEAPLAGTDQHTETRRVDEGHARQVDHHGAGTSVDRRVEGLAQRRRGGHVDLAPHAHHRNAVPASLCHFEFLVHTPSSRRPYNRQCSLYPGRCGPNTGSSRPVRPMRPLPVPEGTAQARIGWPGGGGGREWPCPDAAPAPRHRRPGPRLRVDLEAPPLLRLTLTARRRPVRAVDGRNPRRDVGGGGRDGARAVGTGRVRRGDPRRDRPGAASTSPGPWPWPSSGPDSATTGCSVACGASIRCSPTARWNSCSSSGARDRTSSGGSAARDRHAGRTGPGPGDGGFVRPSERSPRSGQATQVRQLASPDEAAMSRSHTDSASVRSTTVGPVGHRAPSGTGGRGAIRVTSR